MNGWTPIPGISVGHFTNTEAVTGCTVVLCPEGAVAGVDVRGGAPGTRETDLLDPSLLVQKVHAILLSGGSAFGLAAADGVMRWLEERNHGFATGVVRVPIVPAAILFDLGVGRSDVRPGPDAGYAACQSADAHPHAEGSVGAGTGCMVGKVLGPASASKGGLGMASRVVGDLVVNALVAVNALGDVVDPASGQIIAGLRRSDGEGLADSLVVLTSQAGQSMGPSGAGQNTVIGVVATNARMEKAGVRFVARMAQDGVGRAVRPAHTLYDGDTLFALAMGEVNTDVSAIGALAAEAVSEAIVRSVKAARQVG